MDAARCAKRLGAEVYIIYRRGMEELPARKEEVEHAEEEGIIFKTLNNPVEIFADENDDVNKIRCIKMELGEPDASGRRRPIEVPGSEFDIDVDCVIMALGTSPNPLIKSTTKGLEINKKGGIVVNEEGLTSRPNVYAGGDAVTGAATVILAMAPARPRPRLLMSSSAANKEHIEKDADHGSASFLYSCKEQRIILETEASLQNITARCFDNGMAMRRQKVPSIKSSVLRSYRRTPALIKFYRSTTVTS